MTNEEFLEKYIDYLNNEVSFTEIRNRFEEVMSRDDYEKFLSESKVFMHLHNDPGYLSASSSLTFFASQSECVKSFKEDILEYYSFHEFPHENDYLGLVKQVENWSPGNPFYGPDGHCFEVVENDLASYSKPLEEAEKNTEEYLEIKP